MQPPSKSSPDRIRKCSYSFIRRRIGLEPTRRIREIAIEGVTVEDRLLHMKQTQIFYRKLEKKWTS